MATLSQQLLDLQQLDLELERLTRQVEQITASIGDQLKVKAADFAIRQAEGALRTRQSTQRGVEMDLATVEARIKDHEQRLYSGKGSPRDLQALQRDIEHDKERRDELEERALAAMDATEAAQAEVARIKSATDRVLRESAAGKEKLAVERETAQQERSRRVEQRATLAAGIPQPAMQLYERLRSRMPDRVAVAEVVQDRCAGCRTNIPSADVQRARRAPEPVQCPACQRILHVP